MDITDTSKLGDSVSAYFENRVRSVMSEALGPDRTSKFMETFSKNLEANVPPSAVVDAMVPIYARAFSMEEIQGLIQFYESPLGQRIVKVMPKVEEDSQNAGLQLGNKATSGGSAGHDGRLPGVEANAARSQRGARRHRLTRRRLCTGQAPPSGASPNSSSTPVVAGKILLPRA